MPFDLKNVGATYQRLVTKIFRLLLGNTMEASIDDMLVKSKERFDHTKHLQEAFELLRRYDMKVNPLKCAFWSQFGQVFRLYGDPERDRGQSHSTQSYNGLSDSYLQERNTTTIRLTGNSRAVHIQFHRPIKTIFIILRGAKKTGWNGECDQAFTAIKQYLTESLILASPGAGDTLYLYLAILEASVSATLFKEDENRKQRPQKHDIPASNRQH